MRGYITEFTKIYYEVIPMIIYNYKECAIYDWFTSYSEFVALKLTVLSIISILLFCFTEWD